MPVFSFYFNSPDYNVEFFRNFMLVMNALDNRGIVTSPDNRDISVAPGYF